MGPAQNVYLKDKVHGLDIDVKYRSYQDFKQYMDTYTLNLG